MTYKFKTEPMSHQLMVWEHTRDLPEYAINLPPGTGKTKILIDTAAWLAMNGKIDMMIVTAPNGLHMVHADEIEIHWPKDLVPVRVGVFRSGLSVKQRQQLAETVAPREDGSVAVLLVNVEALSSSSGAQFVMDMIKKARFRVLLASDESHTIKNPSARRSKAMLRMAPYAHYRRTMTGTPMGQGYIDLYAPYKFLNPDILGLKTFTGFKSEYAIEQRWERFTTIVGYRNIDKLMERIKPYTVSMKKEDCIDLPPETVQTISLPLLNEQRTAYRDLVATYMAQLESGEIIEAEQVAKRIVRLQQIVSGLFVDDKKHVLYLPTAKLDATSAIVTGTDEQFIVWCKFQADVTRVADRLRGDKVEVGLYYGGVDDATCEKSYRDFQKGHVRGLIATPDKGGAGLNLMMGSVAIWYSHTNRYILWQQARDRIRRKGQTRPTVDYYLSAPGTVEPRLIRTVTKDHKDAATALEDATSWRGWLSDD